MPILTVDLVFTDAAGDQQKYTKLFDAQRDLNRAAWGFIAEPVLRACEAEILYGKYRQDLPDFQKFLQSAGANWFPSWFPSQHAFADLTRSAAHMNTAQAWWQIQNTFWETAHLMAHARAYQDIEAQEADEERRLLVHLTKLQFFNLAAHLICKVEDWFLLLLFVNSGASLIPTINVHKADWPKEITWKAINEGLKLRKSERFCGRFRKSNRYLDALADEETVRSAVSAGSWEGRDQLVLSANTAMK
jgi:hypothetical protein